MSVPSRPRARLLAAALVVSMTAAGCSVVALSAGGTGPATSSNQDRVLGRTDPRATVDVTLVLRSRDPDGLRRFIDRLGSERAPHGFLSAAAFGRRFGLPSARIERVRRILAGAGFTVTATYPQRTAVRARGTASAAEGLFDVTLFDQAVPGGAYHAPDRTPAVPEALRPDVTAVAGLSDRPLVPFHHLGEISAMGLTPSVVAGAYDIAPLQRAGITGGGQTVAIVSFATFEDDEIAAYDRRFGLSGPPVQHVDVAGGTTKADVESSLDVEVIRGIAPSAQILNFEAPNGDVSIGDVIDAIVRDGRARVISISWGFCAQPQNQAERARDQRSIDAAVASGVSIFVASGDAGAYDCQRQNASNVRLSVDWPSSSGGVIAVGGTRLFLTADGSYGREFGWQDVLSDAGAGGGFSDDVPRPTWQRGPGVDTPESTGMRQVPDVAGPADPASGFLVISTDDSGDLAGYQVGGTSAAAPFWAASAALIAQYAAKNGVPSLGFVAPALYALGATPGRFAAFHDVTKGANRRYDCTDAWDLVTGWGSPDVFGLARDLVARAKG